MVQTAKLMRLVRFEIGDGTARAMEPSWHQRRDIRHGWSDGEVPANAVIPNRRQTAAVLPIQPCATHWSLATAA